MTRLGDWSSTHSTIGATMLLGVNTCPRSRRSGCDRAAMIRSPRGSQAVSIASCAWRISTLVGLASVSALVASRSSPAESGPPTSSAPSATASRAIASSSTCCTRSLIEVPTRERWLSARSCHGPGCCGGPRIPRRSAVLDACDGDLADRSAAGVEALALVQGLCLATCPLQKRARPPGGRRRCCAVRSVLRSAGGARSPAGSRVTSDGRPPVRGDPGGAAIVDGAGGGRTDSWWR